MKKKKKILYIITQGSWGGAQRYIFDLAVNLAKNYDISIAVGEAKGNKDLQKKIKYAQPNIKIIQLNHLVRNISPVHDILAIFELRKLYKKIQPDIIHLNSSKAGIIGSFVKSKIKNQKSKIIYTAHGWVFNEPLSWLKKNLYKILEKNTARFKDKIIVLSEQDKQNAINKLKIKPTKLQQIPLGIEETKEKLNKIEARKKISFYLPNPINEGQVWIGTIAGLYKTKGLDILLEAVSKINNQQFFIIGDGPEKSNLQSEIKNLKLTNVHLLGQIKNAGNFIPAFDLFVLPSRKEGLPYVILEAMSAEVPIIATSVGGVPTLIQNKKTGFLIEPESSDLLTKKIIEVIKDKKKLEEVAAGAKQNLKNYKLEEMIKKTISLYQNII